MGSLAIIGSEKCHDMIFQVIGISAMSWFSTQYKYNNTLRRNRGGPYKTDPATDLDRWRLKCVDGAQRWYYIAEGTEPERDQSLLEKHLLGIDSVSSTHRTVESHALLAVEDVNRKWMLLVVCDCYLTYLSQLLRDDLISLEGF